MRVPAGVLCVGEHEEPIRGAGPKTVMRLREALASEGVVVVRAKFTRAQFLALANRLGVAFHERVIYVDASIPAYTRNPSAVPFHTDMRPANVIGWYCVRACQERTPCVYIDGHDAYRQLSKTDRSQLKNVRVGAKDVSVPAAEVVDGELRICWADYWRESVPESAKGAVARFTRALSGERPINTAVVSLEAGDFVLVNNNRFLHGRPALPPDSERVLYQVWINTDGWIAGRYSRIRNPTSLATLRPRVRRAYEAGDREHQ